MPETKPVVKSKDPSANKITALSLLEGEITAYNDYQAALEDDDLSPAFKAIVKEIQEDEVEHMHQLISFLKETEPDFINQWKSVARIHLRAMTIERKDISDDYSVAINKDVLGYSVCVYDADGTEIYSYPAPSHQSAENSFEHINNERDIADLLD